MVCVHAGMTEHRVKTGEKENKESFLECDGMSQDVLLMRSDTAREELAEK